MILVADVLFLFGALIQALSVSVPLMVLGRSIVGLAIGAASFVTPLYLAELAPASHRGVVVTMNVLSITLGQVVAYVVGWVFGNTNPANTIGWRLMVGLGAVPALLQCALLFFMPETPRWLVKAGRSDDARAVIRKTAGSDPVARQMADSVLKDIEFEVREEADAVTLGGSGGGEGGSRGLKGWRELVSVPKNRRALTIACLLQGLQQLSGFVGILHIGGGVRQDSPSMNVFTDFLPLVEFSHVLLRHDIPHARLHGAHFNLINSRHYEFHIYSCCAATHR